MKIQTISSTRTLVAVGLVALLAAAAAVGVISLKNRSGVGVYGGTLVPGYGTPGYTTPSGYFTPGYLPQPAFNRLFDWFKKN